MNNIEVLFDCPVCGKKGVKKNIRIVSERKEAFLVHINCLNCKTSSLAVLPKKDSMDGAVTVGALTDLDYDEACRFLQMPPVSADEVLDFYENPQKIIQ